MREDRDEGSASQPESDQPSGDGAGAPAYDTPAEGSVSGGAAYAEIDGVLVDAADVPAGECSIPEPSGDIGADGVTPGSSAEGSGVDLARSALEAARRGAAARPERRRTRSRPVRRGRGYTGSSPDGRDPEAFGELVARMVRDRGWQEVAADASVMGRWEEMVGPDIAEHARPESLQDGELVVVAESTAWATQLRLLAPTILAAISREAGAGVVRKMRVHGPTAPSWKKGPRRVLGRGPRDTYG